MKVAIIGGGAAGFFSALNVKENYPNADVTIFEKGTKLLSKVKVSGGGRCNVTNATISIKDLVTAYPRGGKFLKKLFPIFSTSDTRKWFEARNISLIAEDDGRVFPESQTSQTIINCFLQESERLNIAIKTNCTVVNIQQTANGLKLIFSDQQILLFDKVIVATGGASKLEHLNWLAQLGHKIETPVPSLFTFNMPNNTITELKGIVVNKTITNIQGTKLKANGPLLITHWGMSGPAILKLSAFGARTVHEKNYQFNVQVNWVNQVNTELVTQELLYLFSANQQKNISNLKPFELPDRLWIYLLHKAGLQSAKKAGELGKKQLNKLVNVLTNDIYAVSGKTTFKEEFVSCGGISLQNINSKTMESTVCPNLYFAGEVLDIDGVTGGYNFQAAWTTSFIASKLSN